MSLCLLFRIFRKQIKDFIRENLNSPSDGFQLDSSPEVKEGIISEARKISSCWKNENEAIHALEIIGSMVFSCRKTRFHLLVFLLFTKNIKDILLEKFGKDFTEIIVETATKIISSHNLNDTLLTHINTLNFFHLIASFLFHGF